MQAPHSNDLTVVNGEASRDVIAADDKVGVNLPCKASNKVTGGGVLNRVKTKLAQVYGSHKIGNTYKWPVLVVVASPWLQKDVVAQQKTRASGYLVVKHENFG
jgi:hypothetical protein